MLSDFCAQKAWKKGEKIGEKNTILELKEMDSKQITFLNGIVC